jgi:hypothetical protein
MLARQIREAVDTAINRAPGADLEWVRRHFIHHNNASYFVIPNLYSCDPENKDEAAKAMAINQLAGVLSDLDLVRWPKGGKWWSLRKNELKKLKQEESEGSDTDLTAIRKKWAEEQGMSGDDLHKYVDKRAVRNHGLFSKAERALQIAGWSEKARNDIEIFKLVDSEGLTPLLMVLNEPGNSSRSTPPAEESDAA